MAQTALTRQTHIFTGFARSGRMAKRIDLIHLTLKCSESTKRLGVQDLQEHRRSPTFWRIGPTVTRQTTRQCLHRQAQSVALVA